ncbi:MAG: ExeM/NucH family extracellular endonuclease [Synechococcales bacterium]|nr:ExeM/NucH family extracellular endonuclease [Synechococcales bacterium]
MALNPGNIAFVGFNADGSDNLAFVALVDIAIGETIYFEDNEWNGTSFIDTNEGAFSWTATSVVTAGTIVRIDNIGSGTLTASTGTVTIPVAGRGTNRGISASEDVIYAYQGTPGVPTQFLTAIANNGFSTTSAGLLTNTGLTAGVNAIDLSVVDAGADIAAYTGSRTGQTNFSDYLALINNPSNWQTQDATGDQNADGIFPDIPFSGALFSVATANPTVNLSASSNTGSEAGTTVITLTATASSNVATSQTVVVSVTGSGITAGDYVLSNTTITIPAGFNSGNVTFTIADDDAIEGLETAIVSISNPSSGLTLGTTTSQSIAITDNDNPVTIAPTITETTVTPFVNLAATGSGIVSGVIGDPTDPARTLGIDFAIADGDTDVNSLTVTVASSNPSVVPNANLTLTGTGANRNLKINPVAVGTADITVTVSDGINSNSYVINYAASAGSSTPNTTRFHTGTSDASTAIAIDSGFMFVADDEDQTLRLYDRNDSGLALNSFDFTTALGLTQTTGTPPRPREVDIEASTRIGNTIYWMGSHSNSSGGSDRPNRERIFATTLSGTGAAATLTFSDRYDFLEDDLIAWDNTNGHGLGAGFLGLAASAANGVLPEQSNGFNIEGLTIAPDGTTAYVAFRAPLENTTLRTKALIVPVLNFNSLVVDGNVGSRAAGSATFGAPIQLDLGGRGIRSIERNNTGQYVIIAGSAGATGDFQLYTWSGQPTDAPILSSVDLNALAAGGSFESIVEVPDNLTSASQIQVLVDNGDNVWYPGAPAIGTTISKELPQDNFQKFRSDLITNLGTVVPLPPTKIHTIQGSGTATPLTGTAAQNLTIEGIVVGYFPSANGLRGFYVQEEDSDRDGNDATSEGIFVFDPNGLFAAGKVGQKVRVRGNASEAFGQTQLTLSAAPTVLGENLLSQVTPTIVNLNATPNLGTNLERYEGMLVQFSQQLTVTEHFNLDRFGEISLSANGILQTPTDNIDPNDSPASGTSSSGTNNAAAVNAQQAANNGVKITLDDGSNVQNPNVLPYINRTPGEAATIRIGSTIDNLTGVLGFGFSQYRIQRNPYDVNDGLNQNYALDINYAPRPDAPTVGGSVKVASFNVLNYFTTLANGSNNARGANSAAEFQRQKVKIISAISQLNADVVGLIEMENNGTTAIADLVAGLNAVQGAGTYAFINDPAGYNSLPGGSDAIKVAFIYKPGKVTPVGNAIAPNNAAFTEGRAPVAQVFQEIATGERFTPIINHFKSKSSAASLPGDSNQNDGQGLSNATRKAQATALADFISDTVVPQSGEGDVLILGDLNAYSEEDPIDILRSRGYTKLATEDGYIFDGQAGSLDHALVTASLNGQVSGAAKWNINAYEPDALDYNDQTQDTGETFVGNRDGSLYQPDAFRSSDHDPLLVGLNLNSQKNIINGSAVRRDVLTGTTGEDVITGFEGADVLTGGEGRDRFVYQSIRDAGDHITDFQVGQDLLVLTDLFRSLNLPNLTLTTAISEGYLGFLAKGSDTALLIDRDGGIGGGRATPFITVQNVTPTELNNALNFVL